MTQLADRLGLNRRNQSKRTPGECPASQKLPNESEDYQSRQSGRTPSADSFDSSSEADAPPVHLSIRPISSQEDVHKRCTFSELPSPPIYAAVNKSAKKKCKTLPNIPKRSPVIRHHFDDSENDVETDERASSDKLRNEHGTEIIVVNEIYGQFGETAEPIYDQVPLEWLSRTRDWNSDPLWVTLHSNDETITWSWRVILYTPLYDTWKYIGWWK